jgi:autotransporter-associated beta strand protein
MKSQSRPSTPLRPAAVLTAAIAATLLSPDASRAASGTWTGSAGDGLWQSPANWTALPGSTAGTTSPDVATFTGSPASTSVTVDPNRNIAGITFADTPTPFTIGSPAGNALTLSNAGVIHATNTVAPTPDPETTTVPPVLVAAPLVLAGPTYTFTNDAPNTTPLRFTGPIAPSTAPTTLTLNGTNTAGFTNNITSQILGALADAPGGARLSLVKEGTGSWQIETVNGANTYSGDTVINSGILRFTTAAAASPNSKITINPGGNLRNSFLGITFPGITLNRGGTLSVSTAAATIINLKAESGPALLINYAGGTGNIINVPISLTGTTPLEGGITFNADASTPQSEIGATGSPFNVGTVTRPIFVAEGAEANSYDLRIRGPVGGTGGILKTGPGTLRIDNANNSYTGTFDVRAGELRFNNSNPFTGATLPELLVTGGTFRVTGDQTQTFRAVTLTKGSVIGSNAGSTLKAPSFALNVAAGDTATADIVLADSASPASVTKTGAGTATLAGTNTYTGQTTVSAGTLVLKGSGPRNHVLNGAGATLSLGSTLSFDYDGANGGGTVHGQIVSLLQAGQPADFSAGPIRSDSPAPTRGFALADDGNAVSVTAAYYGDLNLDQKVNADDYALIDRHVARFGLNSPATWSTGDFNYDGLVTAADFLRMDATFATAGTPHEPLPALLTLRQSQFGDAYVAQLLTSIPEPSSLAACGFASLPLLRRQRRTR